MLVTAFQHAVVPPPMCTYELQLQQAVNQVAFHIDPKRSGDMAILDADNKISVYRYGESVLHCLVKGDSVSLRAVSQGTTRVMVTQAISSQEQDTSGSTVDSSSVLWSPVVWVAQEHCEGALAL